MKTLIVGRYSQQADAESARRELLRVGFPAREMSLFYVSPQGQHATYPVGGDEDESAGTHEARAGAVRGAAGGVGAGALVGVATLPVLGPGAPVLGAAVGAYTGALVGALKNMEEPEASADSASPRGEPSADAAPRKAGMLLAVAVATPAEQEAAIEILGVWADELEAAEGTLENGDWIDFNPLAPGTAIARAEPRQSQP
ncbi:MAG: hypothetical protein K0M46_10115 [Thiobacillus sp.]|nr:hypothetical protein [Thiobacillus sp.]